MTNIVAAPPEASHSPLFRFSSPLWLSIFGLVVVAALATGIYFINANWPYRYRKIKPLLEDVMVSQVQITEYHRTYFPHPGFVAIGLTLHRKTAPDIPPIGAAQRMIVQGSWTDLLLLRQRVQIVDIIGLHIVIPPPGTRANQEDFPPGSSSDFSGPDTAIGVLKMHDTLLDIERTDGGRLSFPIRELDFRNVAKGTASSWNVDMQNAIPTGHILANGNFGPLNPNNLAATPVSGEFSFTSVRLHDVGDIGGTLSSSGKFHGSLGAMEAYADTHTPDFTVDDGRPTSVSGSVQCTVNGLNGDVSIEQIQASTGTTRVQATGTVAGAPKAVNLDLTVLGGHAQDLLRPFMKQEVPVTGKVSLRAHAYLAPSSEGGGFFHRLRVDGVFDVPAEKLTDRATEESLSQFSRRAQGEKTADTKHDSPPSSADNTADALSSLKGSAQIRDAIVSSPRLTFAIPGAQADLNGTFDLHSKVVHLTGNLRMQSDISHTATGFKSFLLKPLAPFFKKRNAGAVVPIAVTGGPGHYQVTQDLSHQK